MPELTPTLWIGLSALLLSVLTTFMLSIDELGVALQARAWTRVGVFLLALLAGFGTVLLVAVSFDVLPGP
jgi:hypothetical protein